MLARHTMVLSGCLPTFPEHQEDQRAVLGGLAGKLFNPVSAPSQLGCGLQGSELKPQECKSSDHQTKND